MADPYQTPTGLGDSSRSIQHRETEVRRPAREGLEAASRQTRARGENVDEPQTAFAHPALRRTGSSQPSKKFDPTPCRAHRIPVRGGICWKAGQGVTKPRPGALPQSSRTRFFCPNTPVSKLIGHVIRATEANNAAPIPPNMKKDGRNEHHKTSRPVSNNI